MKNKILFIFLLIGIKSFAQDIDLTVILKQLNLKESQCKTEFIVSRVLPNNINETIVVIPEIDKEEEGYFTLHSHILLIDTNTSKIKQAYFEDADTNGWVSDAIILDEIIIDTAAYMLTEKTRAFGIRLKFRSMSGPNPYSADYLSLYAVKNQSLKKILNSLGVYEYTGETDMQCYGEFIQEDKVLIISGTKTNAYNNIIVKNKISDIKWDTDTNGECNKKTKSKYVKTVLRYNNTEYIEDK